ncbi:hypothetical protein V1282_004314 [Nitrobacteraceae bacterium AZCC 2146]
MRAILDRHTHEYELRNELDGARAAPSLEFARNGGRSMLVFANPGSEPLDRLIGAPMEMGCFLGFAIDGEVSVLKRPFAVLRSRSKSARSSTMSVFPRSFIECGR